MLGIAFLHLHPTTFALASHYNLHHRHRSLLSPARLLTGPSHSARHLTSPATPPGPPGRTICGTSRDNGAGTPSPSFPRPTPASADSCAPALPPVSFQYRSNAAQGRVATACSIRSRTTLRVSPDVAYLYSPGWARPAAADGELNTATAALFRSPHPAVAPRVVPRQAASAARGAQPQRSLCHRAPLRHAQDWLLLPPHSQDLLRAARSGALRKLHPLPGEERLPEDAAAARANGASSLIRGKKARRRRSCWLLPR